MSMISGTLARENIVPRGVFAENHFHKNNLDLWTEKDSLRVLRKINIALNI